MELSPEQLAEELYRRALDRGRHDETREFNEALSRLIFRYDVDLNFESFDDPRGVVLRDVMDRGVAAYPVVRIDDRIRCAKQVYSDVCVLVDGKVPIGWVSSTEVTKVDETMFTVNVRSLHEMPETFDFAQACPHMSVYGGVYLPDENAWECFGCGKLLARVLDKVGI